MSQQGSRVSCKGCGYLLSQCVCAWRPCLKADLEILIIQDPKEAAHAKNTVALLRLALPQIRCIKSSDQTALDDVFNTLDPHQWRLIFPSEQSVPIESLSTPGKEDIKGVIFIDATWRKARKIFLSDSRWQGFKMLNFSSPPLSEYDIRKKPNVRSLSTLEACAYTVEALTDKDMTKLRRFMYDAQQFQWRQQPHEHKHNSEAKS